MFEYGYLHEVFELESEFTKIKRAVETEKLPCYFAKSKVNALLKKEKTAQKILDSLSGESIKKSN